MTAAGADGSSEKKKKKTVLGGWVVPSTEVDRLKDKDAVIVSFPFSVCRESVLCFKKKRERKRGYCL